MNNSWTRPGLAHAAVALALFAAAPVYAQWTDVGSQRAATEREAVVRSENAAEIRIWLDETQALRMQFKLAPGLVAFAPQGCATVQIDDHELQNLSAPAYECSTDGASVQLLLTRMENNQLDSPLLLDLMNGRRVQLRYRLSHVGYQSAQFSLRGSKQALSDSLGEDIEIIGGN
jgi:hypothetical protein